MQANPCTSPTSTAAAIPATRPAHAEPVTAAVAAAANAETSILPSSPMSTIPERSAKRPPSAASTSGAAPRAVAAASSARTRMLSLMPLSSAPGARARWASQERVERSPQRVLEGATDEDDQPLDHHDHVARELGHVERELGATLVERAEQHRGDHDADRMIAPHQRDGDAHVAGAAGKIQQQAMLYAHHLVQAHEPGERARDRHRDDDRARRLDAAVDRGRLVVAERAQRVAPARVP